MKTISGCSAWACAIIVCVSASVALIGSSAHAQTGWGVSASEAAAAKKPPPPPPPPIQIGGTWDGTIQDNIKGPGTINLTFTEKVGKTKATLKGTWMVSFPDTAPLGVVNDFGTVTGSVVGSVVALTLVPQKGDDIGNCRIMVHSVLPATQEMISATFSACGHNGTINIQPGPPSNTVFINIGDDFFFPTKVTISRGQTVRWTNNGNEGHSVNANPGPGTEKCRPFSGETFDSPTIGTGQTFERTFNNPGSFAYHCEIHGCPMKGTITVR